MRHKKLDYPCGLIHFEHPLFGSRMRKPIVPKHKESDR